MGSEGDVEAGTDRFRGNPAWGRGALAQHRPGLRVRAWRIDPESARSPMQVSELGQMRPDSGSAIEKAGTDFLR